MTRTPHQQRTLVALAGAAGLAAAIAAGPAGAIPWDKGGAIPPSRDRRRRRDPTRLPRRATPTTRRAAGRGCGSASGPRLAGESGTGQTVPTVAEDPAKRDAALRRLKGDRFFAVRLNRLFMADGEAGIRRFKRLARRFARMGLEVELQVRYHPAPADDGDIAKWLRFVRRVVREFGPIRRVTGLQITNEVNISFSPNTSDGAYRRATEALVEGVVAAKRESRRLGFDPPARSASTSPGAST